MRPDLTAAAQALHLPNFMVPVPGLVFNTPVPLNKGYLLADFNLSKQNTDIPLDQQADALKMIDLTEQADHS